MTLWIGFTRGEWTTTFQVEAESAGEAFAAIKDGMTLREVRQLTEVRIIPLKDMPIYPLVKA